MLLKKLAILAEFELSVTWLLEVSTS